MYRLLIVTESDAVKNQFDGMQGWEKYNCKQPRVRDSFEQAVECMEKHPIDAIAVTGFSEADRLSDWLRQYRPDMPVFEAAGTEEEEWQVVRELQSLLNRLHADDSNDAYDACGKMSGMRRRWIKKLICGMIPTEKDLCRQMNLYRMSSAPDTACLLARLSIPLDDPFIAERWHYGSDRLEIALHNFFGSGHDHMRLYVAVADQTEVRVLILPNCGSELNEDSARAYIQETIEQIEHYLGLNLSWIELRRVSALREFAAEK